MTPKQYLNSKYSHYKANGKSIFTVTLSTCVKEYSPSPTRKTSLVPFPTIRFRDFWENHFIYKLKKRLPKTAPIDHDYVIELTPPRMVNHGEKSAYYHYHGLIAIQPQHSHRIWADGSLRNNIYGALMSFKHKSPYRPFTINSFLIEPLTEVSTWTNYITKSTNSIYNFL
jgi:hypothetical protein